MRRTSIAWLAWMALSLAPSLAPSTARAQSSAEPEGTGATMEEPDATRLDVERLPPEAIQITRDLYAHGFFLEAAIGARGWIGGVGEVSSPGPFAAIGLGYELLDWLFVRVIADLSIHQTSAPPPPGTSVFELFSALGAVKLQTHPTAEFALWIEGQAGMIIATTDVLGLYGLQDAGSVGFTWGADLGVDAHFHSRHYSIGLQGGVRGAPSLDGPDGELALGVHGAAYLRYVF